MSNAPQYNEYTSESDESSSEDESTDSDDVYYTTAESLLRSPDNIPLISPNKVFGQIFRGTTQGKKTEVATTVGNVSNLQDAKTKIEFKESRNTTLFMINSRDRDTNVYPQPTFFTLRLPRLYRNVTTLNISQINLLNSFFNFSFASGNTYMNVYEEGRTIVGSPTDSIQIRIRDGTYSADDLVTELNSALNATPLFASISLTDFIAAFQTSGDFTPLFNTPGVVVYNSLTQSYDIRVSIQDIVARYFQVSQSVGNLTYSYSESLVAYYYPVMKEMMLDPALGSTPPFDTITATPPTGYRTWYDYIVFGFAGLDDPYITAIVKDSANQIIFDIYHNQKTYNEFLVNAYTCSYNSKQGRLVISAPSLSQSITTDLNNQYSNILATVISSNPQFTNIDDFQNQYDAVVNSNGFIIEFYNYIQSRFTSNFAINFGTYSPQFFGVPTNKITLYNPTDNYGWNTVLTPAVSESTINSSYSAPEQVDNFWSNIKISKTLFDSNISTFVSTIQVPSFAGTELTFSNADESVFGFTDVVFPILPTSYIRNVFTSRCRQSLSLMTIPRYLNNRTSATEEVYNLGSTTTSLLFSKSASVQNPAFYILTDISGNIQFNLYTLTQSMLYSPDYMRAEDQWLNFTKNQILNGTRLQFKNPKFNSSPPKNEIRLQSYRPFLFFQLNADTYYYETNAHFYIRVYIETQDDTNFGVPITVSWYKDRAGFMADIASPLTGGKRNCENPRHCFQSKSLTGSQDFIDIDVNNLQQTYLYIHFDDSVIAATSIPLRVFGTLRDTYGDYTIQTQADRLDLPFANLPSLYDQFTPDSAVFQNPLTSIFDPAITQLGYDSNQVSNNLLDYTILGPNNIFYDPNNITDYYDFQSTGLRYAFDLSNVGAGQPPPSITPPSTWSLYFDSNSANRVVDNYNTDNPVYLSTLQTFSIKEKYNQAVIANWFNPDSPNNEIYFSTTGIPYSINVNTPQDTIFLPCINVGTPLNTDMSTATVLSGSSGISGVGFFLPPNNVVKMNSIVLKFAYTQPSSDSANNIVTRFDYPRNTINTTANYQNRTAFIKNSDPAIAWDDWFLFNRRNVKLGIFATANISSATSLSLSSAIYTMKLQKVTQINNLVNNSGTLYTREPDWGTYYSYEYEPSTTTIWSPLTGYIPPPTEEDIGAWTNGLVSPPDVSPTYVTGNVSYSNFFLTHPVINNYSYLPREYGIAPSVGFAVNSPYLNTPSWQTDIPNSYTAVPFYYDFNINDWRIGAFHGLSFTRTPAIPSTGLIGEAAYYGPPGIFAWNYDYNTTSNVSTFTLMNGEQPSFQPYYWNMKIDFENLYLNYDPATDLQAFGNFDGISTEYQDTMLFFYENTTQGRDLGDISSATTMNNVPIPKWVWGQEKNSNYSLVDDQSGYNFLSYMNNITVRSTIEYATHVRAYDPIPTFVTGLRFIGKNFTDFGQPSLQEIGQEITALQGYIPVTNDVASSFLDESNGNTNYSNIINSNNSIRLGNGNAFSHAYADQLILFDQTFYADTITFGAKIGFSGVTIPGGLSGYNDAYQKYLSYYTDINSLYSEFTAILSTTQGQLNEYIISRYGSVLPPNITSRNRFTDPLPFQLLLSTTLVAPYTGYYDEWGLGYYLGFNKADRPDQPRTTVTSDTFIRIVQDYIYLRVNPEQNANTMGVSAKENLAETRESQGEDTKYFSKIILNNFGEYSRTALIQQKQFKPVLGRMETITCQLVGKNGQQINNTGCEYDMVLEITELTNTPVDTNSLSGPTTDLNVYQNMN